MKQTTIIFSVIIGSTLLFSCGSRQQENNIVTKQETPQALQDGNSELKSLTRSSNDLTEELYQELVDKTPALKKLEEDINAIQPKQSLVEETYIKYTSKSNMYYANANTKTSTIKDSLLKRKIVNLITNSNNQYISKSKELTSLFDHISDNTATLEDHHSVLKIVLTLPLIEKYQNENSPDKKEFRDLIFKQEKLKKQTDSLTPKY